MPLKSIAALKDLHGKTVLVRIDSDVDIKNGVILDDTRLVSSLDTIQYIVHHGGNVILLGHLGRPEGRENPEFTMLPIAKWFAKGKHVEETQVGGFSGWKMHNNLTLLENLRFHKEEENPDSASGKLFTKELASLGDIFVNEAFAVSHRDHTSITRIAKLLPSYAGLHLLQEAETLSRVLQNPKRPLVVLIGGAKLETKLPMVEKMHAVADYVLVGGKIAEEAKTLFKVQEEKTPGHKSIIFVADGTPDGLDITEKDTENFIQVIKLGKTIVWNGPMGKMGDLKTEESSLKIANAIIESRAYTVLGGGDSISLLSKHHLLNKFSFVSVGGGAMLEFLSGKKLPGIEALEN